VEKMKPVLYLVAVILLSGAAVHTFSRAEAQKNDAAEVLTAEHACAGAFVKSDIATLDRLIAEDYVEIIGEPVSGNMPTHWSTRSKQEWLNLVRTSQKKYLSVDVHDERVFLHGDVATVLAQYSQTVSENGKNITESGPEIDTWRKKNGHWQVISSVFP
jgi:hypothetical protein